MANILDYLEWRGDLTMEQAPFNHIDALILSRLSYIPFDGIVLGRHFPPKSISKAAAVFFALKDAAHEVYMPQDADLLLSLANNRRFQDMKLSGYENKLDYESQMQFSAITIDIGDSTHFISYRGTDDTLVGWKENFNMSFMTPVPAQKEAVRYLEEAAETAPGNIRAGGHSKGGNLAVYAASFCREDIQERIITVYNNDGPGFDSAVITSKGYLNVSNRIKTFIPQSSIVGMLLEHEEEYIIIYSTQVGLLQHDLYTWKVKRDDFIYLDTVTNDSKYIDKTLKDWLSALDLEQREQFIEAIFGIFIATNAHTLTELTTNWHKNALLVLKSLTNMDVSVKHAVSQVLHLLTKSAAQNLHMLKPNTLSLPNN